jgi:hypothetical protein
MTSLEKVRILKKSSVLKSARILLIAFFNCSIRRPHIEPEVSRTKTTCFLNGFRFSGAKKWTKYPFMTYDKYSVFTCSKFPNTAD